MFQYPLNKVKPARQGWLGYLLGGIALICFASSYTSAYAGTDSATPDSGVLLVTQFKAHHLAYVDPQKGVVARVKVGRAPYDVALVTIIMHM